jgi:hypothetical protein
MEETMDYLPVQRTAIEELKWLEMQAKIAEIKKAMGDKWLLAKPVERVNG